MNVRTDTFTVGGERVNSVLKRVYLWMCGGLSITALASFMVLSNEGLRGLLLANRGVIFIIFFAEIGLVLYLSRRIFTMPYNRAVGLFVTYSALNGITLAPIVLIYTSASIVSTFFVTAGTFGALSIWAYTTKRDLSGWGQYLFFGLIGIIIASVVNIFLGNGGLEILISAIGVVLFMGLTAYDTQMISRWSAGADAESSATSKLALLGALKLYLDFINLFLFLLRFMGRRR